MSENDLFLNKSYAKNIFSRLGPGLQGGVLEKMVGGSGRGLEKMVLGSWWLEKMLFASKKMSEAVSRGSGKYAFRQVLTTPFPG